MAQPLTSQYNAVKRIFRYLRVTLDFGLALSPTFSSSAFSLHRFCEANQASDVDDRRSTSGACIYLALILSLGGPRIRPQWLVPAKTEFWNFALATTEVLWIQSLLHELQIKIATPVICYDNQSTIAFSHNPVLHSRTKHMELDIFFIREKVLNKSLIVTHVPTFEQIDDVLTKPMAKSQFAPLRDKLRVLSSSQLSH